MSKVVAACEERINAMRADHNIQIQQRKMTFYLIFDLRTDIMIGHWGAQLKITCLGYVCV